MIPTLSPGPYPLLFTVWWTIAVLMYGAYWGPPGQAPQFHGRSGAHCDRATMASGIGRPPPAPFFVGAHAAATRMTAATSTAGTRMAAAPRTASPRRRRTTTATATVESATAARLCGSPKPCSAGREVVVTAPEPPPGGAAGAVGAGAVVAGAGVDGAGGVPVDSTFASGFLPSNESITWSFTSWAVPSSRRTRTPETSLPTQIGSLAFVAP